VFDLPQRRRLWNYQFIETDEQFPLTSAVFERFADLVEGVRGTTLTNKAAV
jgi:hypothetical protein